MFLILPQAYYVITGKSQIFYFYFAEALIFVELPAVHEAKYVCIYCQDQCVGKPSLMSEGAKHQDSSWVKRSFCLSQEGEMPRYFTEKFMGCYFMSLSFPFSRKHAKKMPSCFHQCTLSHFLTIVGSKEAPLSNEVLSYLLPLVIVNRKQLRSLEQFEVFNTLFVALFGCSHFQFLH